MFKRSLVCAAALCAVAGSVSAQSTVTVFGILDAGVRYVKKGGNDITLLSSGGVSTSRLGFRGVEDLGGGLKAGFWLESQVNVDDGSTNATKFWNRRSTVSLSGTFGEVRLGRDFSPVYRVSTGFDPFSDTGMGAITSVFATGSINGAAYANHTRMDNSVTYFLPGNLGGIYGQATAAAGEGVAGNRLVGGLVGYKAGALDASIGYSQTQVTVEDVEYFAAGASYDFGVAKLMGSYSQIEYTTAKERHVSIGALVPVGPGTLRASYVNSVGKGGTFTADGVKNEADLFAVGYVYDLSKRTSLYSNLVHIKNKGGANYNVSGVQAGWAGTKSSGVDFGLRHSF